MRAALALYSLVSCLTTRFKNALYDRGRIKPRRAPLPVISVGNITLGGTGKTPLAIDILERLLEDGHRPALVTRGYRGLWERKGGVLSDGRRLHGGWREGGDEPFMVARRVPGAGVFVGRHRYSSCLKARELGFEVVVLDDGFQHRKLSRDLDIVLYDPGQRSALREPVSALKRAGLVLVPEGALMEGPGRAPRGLPAGRTVGYRIVPRMLLPLRGGKQGDVEKGMAPGGLRQAKVLAFCGIAGPDRFFKTLEDLGLVLLDRVVLPDHWAYTAHTLDRIQARGSRLGAEAFLTTEKDAVKIEGLEALSSGPPFYALRVALAAPDRLRKAVTSALPPSHRGRP